MFENVSAGFSLLPCHAQRKTLKKGFHFTLMVVGESGLGKSTVVNSLFLTDMYPDRIAPSLRNKVSIEPSTVEIDEEGVKVKITIIDTPGFGDSIDGSTSHDIILNYIDQQYENYYQDEKSVPRRNISDTRVHACLFFISPFGHGLKPIDIKLLSQIHNKVNIIPVIAKADALTRHELANMRLSIQNELSEHEIHFYLPDEQEISFSGGESDRGDGASNITSVLIPFAVSGANTVVTVGEEKFRGRLYPWGFLDVENPKFSDLSILRQFLISNMQDLLDETHEVFYEAFRLEKISSGLK